MRFSGRALQIITAVSLLGGCDFGREDKVREMDAALRAVVENTRRPVFVTADAEGTRLWRQTRQFYTHRHFAPAWVEGARPRPQMEALIGALRESASEGLDPEMYNVTLLEQRRAEASKGFLTSKGFDPREAGALDVWLTYLYMKFASDMADGLSDLAHADPAWKIAPEKFDPREHLETALAQNRIRESLAELAPQAGEYRALRDALARYRQIAADGGWKPLPATLRLKPGQKSAGVPALAARLAASGDFTGRVPAAGTATYGPQLVQAVKHFQRRHGLEDDGAVGPAVVAQLNVPVEARVRQIELNMERWRWLPRDLGSRHILVNIPEMRLKVWDNGRVPLSMRVVVGRKDTQTPIFGDEMSYVVFSPYWNVPDSIAQGETLPAFINDPEFLARNNMEVIDADGATVDPASMDLSDPARYRFRQRPGGENSLGLVKFMFPNQYNVYLHDTPANSLFTRANRAFSHGCVRLEDPVALAEYVLRDQPAWTRARIIEAMNRGEEETVRLKETLPVYLGYWTAGVDGDGAVQFREDVYGIDSGQRARLANRLERLRRANVASAATPPGATSQRPAPARPPKPGAVPAATSGKPAAR